MAATATTQWKTLLELLYGDPTHKPALSQKLLRSYIKDGKISFAELPEIEPHVRDVFLLWLSKALENKHFRGKTESGEIYYIENADTKEICMLHAKDGILQMPAYTIRFEEKE